MIFRINAIFLFCLISFGVYAQQDIFVVYSSSTHSFEILDSPTYDTTLISGNTDWYLGTLPGFSMLPQEPPEITFPGAGFTELIRADSVYTLTDFPMRTAVKLFGYLNDSLVQQCSGIIVGSNVILTAAHCVCYTFDSTNQRVFLDSMIIVPAYNEGSENNIIGKSIGSVYYVPLDWNNNTPQTWKDIALVKSDDQIGQSIGWVGIAFNNDETFLNDNLFYKFSYPVGFDLTDSLRYFDSRYIYYNYGKLDIINSSSLGIYMNGIPGQSGSSLIYSDNNSFFSFGVQNWSGQSKHFRITKNNFYILKQIINNLTDIDDNDFPKVVKEFYLSQNFPNPFNSGTIINYSVPITGFISLKVYDVLGREITTLLNETKNVGEYFIRFDAEHLNSGIYFYTITGENFIQTRKMILLK